MQYKLGRAITTIVPFIRIQQQLEDKSLVTNKLIIIMVMVAIAKIAVLLML